MDLRQQAQLQQAQLQQLPQDLLAHIWGRLEHAHNQHALRCACAAAVRATSPLIHALAIHIYQTGTSNASEYDDEDEEERPVWRRLTWEEALDGALDQLGCFPAAAIITDLRMEWQPPGFSVGPASAPLPALLPGFLSASSGRLAAVRTLRLAGKTLRLGHGDMSTLADGLPHLTRLRLWGTSIIGPAFEPLSRLPRLSSLTLEDVAQPHRSTRAGASLAGLVHLTELHATDVSWTDGVEDEAFVLEDVLPNLGALTALSSLKLRLRRQSGLGGEGALRRLPCSAAARLTSLDLGLRTEAGGCLLGDDIQSLSAATALVKLTLLGATLGPCATRALAALPRLAELTAGALDPQGADLSSIPCGWRSLTLERCESPGALLTLPLRGVTDLRFAPNDMLAWTLDPDADALRRASEVLGRAWRGMRSEGTLHLHLTLKPAAPPPGAAATAPVAAAATERLLSALAPLAPHAARLDLRLGHHWPLGAEHVRALAHSLPGLPSLTVNAWSSPRFAVFAAVLATGLPQLRRLMVTYTGSLAADPTLVNVHGVEEALLVAAGIRANLGLPLKVLVLDQSYQRRTRCNAALQAASCSTHEGGEVSFVGCYAA